MGLAADAKAGQKSCSTIVTQMVSSTIESRSASYQMGRQRVDVELARKCTFTQALWRAARFIGCGESVKSMGEGKMCRVQVCRYTRTGNCGMGSGVNWKGKMMEDFSNCGHACPPEGCF
ncbi:hypothetical protein QTG54_001337 [Skeletonema marinoi]|uniref:Uncharacterized protein n=1 Tax=Skeletonema marinoi TaxID=267567 RepID=A0AAD9DIH8_9STRA|nr:hypothetical protein QTG54_001337 [Skeletonema marinoi]